MPAPASYTLLVGLAVESTLWGVYLHLLFWSFALCYRRAEHERPPRPVFVMSGLLFVACTMHLMSGIDAVLAVTNVGVNAISGSPGDILIPLCNAIGLLLLVNRCWKLWGKETWVVLPAGAAALLGFVLTTNFAFNPSDPDGLLSTILSIIGHSFLLYSNLSTIPLIAAGLDRRSYFLSLDNPQEKKTLVSAASVLVECGLLHLLAQAVLFLFVVLEHPFKYAVGAGVVQIFGCSSALGLVRTGLGHTMPDVDVELETRELTAEEEEEAKAVERAVLRAFDCDV
ncbi:hypothetical protein K466DRAFT_666106 [Polyporus arcularius HHB13444]|uniref:Uncharacterized protein n=1 Tax=Polyporus arcularius HHB13444 TaxID=1314778 RepID=A0A5C3P1A6_9APHY|nr:hypothetical protein K466DRAFT_666106 [Polyporus arcularius HHB13444]